MIEREELVAGRKEGRETRYYPIESKNQTLPMITMHKKVLLKNMLINIPNGVTLDILSRLSPITRPTVRAYMDYFEKEKVVEEDIRGKQRVYYFTQPKREILKMLQKMKKTTTSNIASFLGFDEGTIQYHLREMKELGILNTTTGFGGQTFYFL